MVFHAMTGLRAVRVATALALAWTLAGCGGGGSDAPSDKGEATAEVDYFPLHVGDRWAFQSTHAGPEFNGEPYESVAVLAADTLHDQRAYAYQWLATSNAVPGKGRTTKSATGVQSWGNEADAPWDLIKLPATPGMRYDNRITMLTTDVDSDGREDILTRRIASTVVGLEAVDTPAGRFEGALHMRYEFAQSTKRSSDGQSTPETTFTQEKWFAPNVGLVRETYAWPSGQTINRRLVAYKIDGRATDTTAPRITALSPANGQAGTSNTRLRYQFNEPVQWPALASQAVVVRDAAGTTVPVVYDSFPLPSSDLVLIRPQNLVDGTTYTVQVGNGITDLLGNPLPPFSHTFTVDSSVAEVSWTFPAIGTSNVPTGASMSVSFSAPIDLSSMGGVVLLEGQTAVPVTVSSPGSGFSNDLLIVPIAPLKPSTTYTVTFPGLRDGQGRPIVESRPWTFKTARAS